MEASAPHLVNLALRLVNDETVNVRVRANLLDSLLSRAGISEPKQAAVQISINTEIASRARELLAEREKAKANTITITASATTERENEKTDKCNDIINE